MLFALMAYFSFSLLDAVQKTAIIYHSVFQLLFIKYCFVLILSIINMHLPKTALNKTNKTAVTAVGTILEDMRDEIIHLSNKSLYYPVDPTSRKDALVGGTISCNASGFIPGDKGATRHWVQKLKIILPILKI